MDIFQAAILGIIEGLTEFLPISSTGHLIVVSEWLGLKQTDQNMAFEVIIQVAAILAIFSHYSSKFSLEHIRLWINVLIAFLPIAAIGFLFHNQIKEFFTLTVVAWMFILGGLVFLVMEKLYNEGTHRTRDIDDLSITQAFWIGIIQMFALIPGTSRAGASIVGGVMMGLDRKTSAEFSFLLALPVLAAASGLDLLKNYSEFANSSWLPLIVGFIMAYIVAYLTMSLFLRFLDRFTFNAFGIYRIIFGIVLLVWFV
ncbi:undecaprenyl-diphosphatase [Thiomicrorhabdus immobilis]|uniref:Undecaprenyl-diphosphatase n=1 Tax=Thiomicrorhabdus immobilis TaxID=2791037 RepID=A0ABN6CY99_9GAMM|nr:undecaprenyl-diphosphate phosphatase [Thiomicrorhabdus immobilis]BCN94087.1 undecaprenyl-diphosphatase [Thiomicrorhabdus immobilis]